jgi:hypothetical protein
MNKKVSNYKELQAALVELKAGKLKQEDLIKQNVSGIKEALNPWNMLKSALIHAIDDKKFHTDVIKTGLGLGAEYVIKKFFKTKKSV